MSATQIGVKTIKEGKAVIQLPKRVFYNPVQEFNRDLSVLVVRTYLKHNVWHFKKQDKIIQRRGGMRILDALSASGLRSIRYAKELGESSKLVKQIIANDLSEPAVNLINKNIELNNVGHKVVSSLSDANSVIHRSSLDQDNLFNVIDLDPFGTGAQFFDAAISSIDNAGLLMVTCTDAAVLCGNSSESCFARYGSMSLKGEFCHDMALRIILKSLASHAAVYGRRIKPLLSLSIDFYVRLFVQVFVQPAETKRTASNLSQIYLCKECATYELQPLGTWQLKDDPKQANSNNLAVQCKFKPPEVGPDSRCAICGGRYSLGGPIWNGPIHDKEFLDLLKNELDLPGTADNFGTFRRMQGMIYLCSEELTVPLLHSIDSMSRTLRMRMPKTTELMSALANAGYQVSGTHTNKTGLKTDAPNSVLWSIFCQLAEREGQREGRALELFNSAKKSENEDPKKVNISKAENEGVSMIIRSSADSTGSSLVERIMKRVQSPGKSKVEFDFRPNVSVESESRRLSLARFPLNPASHWGPGKRPRRGSSDDEQQ